MRLKDRVAIVTGAGQGMGRGIALRLAEEGAHIVVAEINEKTAKRTAQEVRRKGRRALAVKTDVTRSADVKGLFQKALATFGRIDILVNNAGVARPKPLVEIDEATWDAVIDTNLKGPFLMMQEAARHWIANKVRGKIVNITSINAEIAYRDHSPYMAAKGGLKMLTRAVALDLGPHGINVNAVGPGHTRTPIIQHRLADPAVERSLTQTCPLGRLAEPEDIANAVLFLATEEADHITGQTIYVDGGRTLTTPR